LYSSKGISRRDNSSFRAERIKVGRYENDAIDRCGIKRALCTKPFFQRVKDSMMAAPVIVCCFEGVDAIQTVRTLAGPTNGRLAAPGTIRGDYSMSFQENIIHASDSPETAEAELKRFFKPEEIFDYKQAVFDYLYANDEY
jgi:nucleoside-diphosphate kinase